MGVRRQRERSFPSGRFRGHKRRGLSPWQAINTSDSEFLVQPALHYMLTDHLSLGGAVGLQISSDRAGRIERRRRSASVRWLRARPVRHVVVLAAGVPGYQPSERKRGGRTPESGKRVNRCSGALSHPPCPALLLRHLSRSSHATLRQHAADGPGRRVSHRRLFRSLSATLARHTSRPRARATLSRTSRWAARSSKPLTGTNREVGPSRGTRTYAVRRVAVIS